PRSASSWAAVMPATPPPSTTTLGMAETFQHLGDVDVALDLQLLQRDPADPERRDAIQPRILRMCRAQVGAGIQRRRALEAAGRYLGVSVGPEVEVAAGPAEAQRSVDSLV